MTDAEDRMDATPRFGVGEIEASALREGETETAVSNGKDASAAINPPLKIRDALSRVEAVADRTPFTIGNGPLFDLALRGPGPDGLYAELRRDEDGALAIERRVRFLFVAADGFEFERVALREGQTIQLGAHTLTIEAASGEDTPRRRRFPKRVAAGLGLAVATLLLALIARTLLFANEATNRVRVVDAQETAEENNPTDGAGEVARTDGDATKDVRPGAAPSREADGAPPQAPNRVVKGSASGDADAETAMERSRSETLKAGGMRSLTANEGPLPETSDVDASPRPGDPARSAASAGGDDPVRDRRVEVAASASRRPTGEAAGGPATRTVTASVVRGDPPSADRLAAARMAYRAGDLAQARGVSDALDRAVRAARASAAAPARLDVLRERRRVLLDAEQQAGIAAEPRSAPRRQLGARLKPILEQAASEARRTGDAARAYALYAELLGIAPGTDNARRFIDARDAEAESLYRMAYRLSALDPGGARAYARRVLDTVPTRSRWHRRARGIIETLGG